MTATKLSPKEHMTRKRTERWVALREDSGWDTPKKADQAVGLNPGTWEVLENAPGWDAEPVIRRSAQDMEKRLIVNPGWLDLGAPYSRVIKPGREKWGAASGRTYTDPRAAQKHLIEAVGSYGYSVSENDRSVGFLGELLNLAGDAPLLKLLNNDPDEMLVETEFEKSILSVPLSWSEKWPSAIGATRRLRGLVAWGHDPKELRRRLGFHKTVFHRTLFGRGEVPLPVKQGQLITKLFVELEHIRGESDFAYALAETKGWELPFQWEESGIDKVRAKPSPRRSEDDKVREYTPAERMAIVNFELSRYWGKE